MLHNLHIAWQSTPLDVWWRVLRTHLDVWWNRHR